jgi:hypothetical protein
MRLSELTYKPTESARNTCTKVAEKRKKERQDSQIQTTEITEKEK